MGELVSGRYLSHILGIDESTVSKLKTSKILELKDGKKFDLAESVQAYIRYTKRADRESDVDHKARKEKADADLQEAKAAQEQLKLAELKGTMHSQADVVAVMEEMIYTVKNMLLAIPGRTAMDLASATAALECEGIVRKEIYKTLEELSKHRYDPEVFKKLVMERIKWMKQKEEEEENAGYPDSSNLPAGRSRSGKSKKNK